jgi:hypothetical protein
MEARRAGSPSTGGIRSTQPGVAKKCVQLIALRSFLNHENLAFDELIKDGRYQFVYVFATSDPELLLNV